MAVYVFFLFILYIQMVKMYYPVTSHRKKLMKIMFEFDTNETEISLYQEAEVSLIKE